MSATDANPGNAKRSGRIATVERIVDHNDDTRSLFLRSAETPLSGFIPGQFISIAIPLPGETRSRPYSIASSPEDGEPFELCFNRVPGGAGVEHLFARRIGDRISFTGPYGLFTLDRPPDTELVFIAEGTGIAPIRPMIRRALAIATAHPIRLLYGALDDAHLLYRRELEQASRANSGFQIEWITSNRSGGIEWLYAELLRRAEQRWIKADSVRARHVYICGVGAGVLRLRDLLRGSGYERRAVKYEQW
ncbi:MAG: FAD-dependent oxidoreductase [Candidatus Binataceae bacterium]|nr:FAD-dependent oxidoreductase [Candidatus Binataceae bacterium]